MGQTSRLHCDDHNAPSRDGCQQQTCSRGDDGQLSWDLGQCASLTPCSFRPGSSRCVATDSVPAACVGLEGENCDVCLDDQRYAGGSIALQFLLILAIFGWPCIMFYCAHHLCIKRHEARNMVPSDNAWMICGTLFSVGFMALFCNLAFFWLVFGTLMVIPFFLEDCYLYDGNAEYGLADRRRSARRPEPPVRRDPPSGAGRRVAPGDSAVVEAVPVDDDVAVASDNPLADATEVVVAGTVVQATEYYDTQSTCPTGSVQGTVAATFEVEDDEQDADAELALPRVHPVAEVGGGSSGDGDGDDDDVGLRQSALTEFLAVHSLLQFETALRGLGAVCIDDLHEISSEELASECGMRVLEVKRLRRCLSKIEQQEQEEEEEEDASTPAPPAEEDATVAAVGGDAV